MALYINDQKNHIEKKHCKNMQQENTRQINTNNSVNNYKKGDKTQAENYRLVSLTSITSRTDYS